MRSRVRRIVVGLGVASLSVAIGCSVLLNFDEDKITDNSGDSGQAQETEGVDSFLGETSSLDTQVQTETDIETSSDETLDAAVDTFVADTRVDTKPKDTGP